MTTQAQHTPSPWDIEISERIGWFYLNKEVDDLIKAKQFEAFDARQQADANLIAAAPDLLEACKWALTHSRYWQVSDALEIAIAKAEGR